jgi:hypothetical protein
MPDIRSGHITVFYLFDIADAVDLAKLPALIGGTAVPARLAPKPATPAYVQYQNPPPLSFEGELVGVPEINGFRVRVRAYDYGVISVALNRPFSGSWVDLIALGQSVMENAALEDRAEQCSRHLLDRLRPALDNPRPTNLSEDYVVFSVHELDRPLTSDVLLETYGEEIALLLRGERVALSRQEREEALRHRISYLSNDLVIPTWSAALVYDTEAGALAALELLEYANSQLLEFRYYDDLLDNELARIYPEVKAPGWYDELLGRRHTKAAHRVHSLFIEVNELTDKTENALKIVGDVYAARLYTLVAARLGLESWKASVQEKLKTLDDIYRFSVEQASMSRGTFLELTIVLILVFELVLLLLGIMR